MRAIPRVRPGDSIRAGWAESIRTGVGDLNRRVLALEASHAQMQAATGQQLKTPAGGGSVFLPTGITYVESSRTATGRTVTDSNGDTHTVNLATQITFVATGATGGMPSSLVLEFTAPT